MSEYFETKDLIWAVIGALIGWLLPELIKKIYQSIAKKKSQNKIKKINDTYIKSNESICPLSHGTPFFSKNRLVLENPICEFHFLMPNDIHKKICEVNPNYEHTEWTQDSYWGKDDASILLKAILSICSKEKDEQKIKDIIDFKKKEIAMLFQSKANHAFFNGEMYGIKCIQDSRKGNEEQAVITIKSIKTDYYTHRVMAEVYQQLICNKMIEEPTGLEDINNYYPFLTSMGMDVLLVIENKSKVVLTKRSKQLINMTEDQWHLSVNEAISITDIVFDEISLDGCVKRGLKEELGLSIDSSDFQLDIHYGDIFFLKKPLEIGITAFVVADELTEQAVRNGYNIAQDAPYESTGNDATGVAFVKLTNKDIYEFCEKNTVTSAAVYCLKMLEVRKTNI